MSRTLICLCLISFMTVACGEPNEIDNSDGEDEEDNQQVNNAGNSDPIDYEDDPYDTGFGDVLTDLIRALDDTKRIGCQCNFIMGYDSEEECVADETNEEEAYESYNRCADHSVATVGRQPPAGLQNLQDCLVEVIETNESCRAQLSSPPPDACTLEWLDDHDECLDELFRGPNQCENAIDDVDLESWGEDVSDAISDFDCNDYIDI